MLIGCLISILLPKQYESTTMVQTRNNSKMLSSDAANMMALMGMGGGDTSSTTVNYIELMQSRTVIEPIISQIGMGEENDVKEFTKKHLKFSNKKQTNIITITAIGRSPEEAQHISKGVVDNFLDMQSNMNKQTQSLLIEFLNERIEITKKEAEDAEKTLAEFSEKHKIYSPDSQIKLAIQQMGVYDKAIGELQVKNQEAYAQYNVITNKLNEQKIGAEKFKINDNETVQSIRSQIVAKEVEMVVLKERYTDKHPDVLLAQKQLNELKVALNQEVDAIVNSNAASLNTTQLELIKNQALAQAQVSASAAAEETVRKQKADEEKKLDTLPDDEMKYLQLKSDAEIKRSIFVGLVQQCEQDKIKKALDSMDVQVIDSANLPKIDEYVFPKKGVFTLLGGLFGVVISLIYASMIMRKRLHKENL